jgi:hypothetical protein
MKKSAVFTVSVAAALLLSGCASGGTASESASPDATSGNLTGDAALCSTLIPADAEATALAVSKDYASKMSSLEKTDPDLLLAKMKYQNAAAIYMQTIPVVLKTTPATDSALSTQLLALQKSAAKVVSDFGTDPKARPAVPEADQTAFLTDLKTASATCATK